MCSGHRPSKGQGPGCTDSRTAAANKLENWTEKSRHFTKDDTQMPAQHVQRHAEPLPAKETRLAARVGPTPIRNTETRGETLGRIQSLDPSFPAGGNAKRYSCSETASPESLKLTVQPPYKPATVLLGTELGAVK